MVRLCQEMNLVVGMTGDGVNDSPALKRRPMSVLQWEVGYRSLAKEAGKIVHVGMTTLNRSGCDLVWKNDLP